MPGDELKVTVSGEESTEEKVSEAVTIAETIVETAKEIAREDERQNDSIEDVLRMLHAHGEESREAHKLALEMLAGMNARLETLALTILSIEAEIITAEEQEEQEEQEEKETVSEAIEEAAEEIAEEIVAEETPPELRSAKKRKFV